MGDLANKLTSRKFWVSVAAFLGSLGGSIAGFATGNDVLAAIGIGCMAFSGAIYAAAEAYRDGKIAMSATTTTSISATSNSQKVVEAALTGNGNV